MVPFPVTLRDRKPRFLGHGNIIDALDILCLQLTRDVFAIAKYLFTPAFSSHAVCSCIFHSRNFSDLVTARRGLGGLRNCNNCLWTEELKQSTI